MARSEAERGAIAVEFAIVVPVFLLILLFAIDAGRIFFVKISLLNAASQGARAAALGLDSAAVIDVTREAAPGVLAMSGSGAASIDVVVDLACPVTVPVSSTDMSQVTASIDYVWSTPLALIQNFDGSSARPGTITVSSSNQWLCQ